MVFIGGQKLACATCIKGHRSSSCTHTDRSLFTIRPKGRPVSQCEHCRELRKTKQVHVKCECDSKPTGVAIATGHGADSQPIVARKGARKIKTLENTVPTFPNGIQDMVAAAAALQGMNEGHASAAEPICTCGQGGSCNCCTDRYISKKANSEGHSRGHANRPSISLTIPPASEGGPSSPSGHHGRSPSITLTPSQPSGSRSHSRSPSRSAQHHAVDGHHIGGSQSDHHSKHAALYSPYSMPFNFPSEPRSHGSSGTNSHNHSPGGQASTAPTTTSPILLIPSADMVYGPDLSHPSSPLSVDFDRPNSSLSIHTGSAGRTTPIDFSVIPGTPNGQGGDWGSPNGGMNLSPGSVLGDGIQAMSLMSGSPVMGSPLDQFMAQSQQNAYTTYRQQDTLSPASPATPQYLLSPTDANSASSPTSFVPPDMSQFNLSGYSDPFQQQAAMGAIQSLMQEGNAFAATGRLSPNYSDVFEEGDSGDLSGILAGHRSRRGSHQSVASSHSGHLGAGPEIRFMSASPIPPQNPMPELNLADMALMDPEGLAGGTRVCPNNGQGCHCWSPTGTPHSEGERCGGPNCPCCNYLATRNNNALASLGLDALIAASNSKFAVSTEREATFTAPASGLQIPSFQGQRSRSSSSSSHTSSHSHVSLGSPAIVAVPNNGASSLNRANSTGQIGRSKFKPILPKPTHGMSASLSYQSVPSGISNLTLQPTRAARSNPPSAGPSGPSVLMPFPNQFHGGDGGNANMNFTFPRPTTAGEISQQQQSPAVIVTEAPTINFGIDPNNAESFKQMMQASFNNPTSSQQTGFGFDPPASSSSSSLFEAVAAMSTASPRHSRNQSQPNAAPSSPSFLQEPKPMPYGHGRSSSTSLLDVMGRSSIEVLVTPPSPFNPGAFNESTPGAGGSPS